MFQRMLTHPLLAIFLILLFSTSSLAHFGMIIPSDNIITQVKKKVDINLLFAHPFEGIGMNLLKPHTFTMHSNGVTTNLLPLLKETTLMDHKAWHTTVNVPRPGVYHLAMEPQPYYEKGEDIFIIHYTKTILAAYGGDTGWDTAIGLPMEILPLLRPFGNYAGNLFTGKVVKNGLPVANAEIEVEFYNSEKKYHAPSEHHITQVLKADENGIFSFVCPWAGWWGFSALQTAEYTLQGPDNRKKEVELGGVLWVQFDSAIETK